ncbi:hypothetical protein GIB67_009891 [Kingdonia uniflora]|uniref:Mei2-like C-terminal RNA recognition motif domain-containing protein n=1 Tax=Kingdonia uniflora TaxID=39325 RepID=A0A7J7L7T7_9MAGN|nr:hypothetical protein GIB67_009891 [Kingdonia uniflora]
MSPPAVIGSPGRAGIGTVTRNHLGDVLGVLTQGIVDAVGFVDLPIKYDDETEVHGRTSAMIKNIPTKLSRTNHCGNENKRVDEQYLGLESCQEEMHKFDFVYFPINFRTGLNLGYAFVNFTRSVGAVRFFSLIDIEPGLIGGLYVRALELLDVFLFRSPDTSVRYSQFVLNTKYNLQVENILGNPSTSEKGGVYYYSERGDRLIDLASFRDRLWQNLRVGGSSYTLPSTSAKNNSPRLATVASGAALVKLLEYEVGGAQIFVQTAYGVEVVVENNPYDPSLMVFMYYRDYMKQKVQSLETEYPTFHYVMPMFPSGVFFEETL